MKNSAKYMIRKLFLLVGIVGCLALASCMGSSRAMKSGGEVTGTKSTAISEPSPYGMVEIKRGYLRTGIGENDSLWGTVIPERAISVDGFWMDQTEVTNSMYRQFVAWVRDSIIRERLADPSYGGDETYKIEVDKNGDPITPHLNWAKAIPDWKKADEDQLRAIESLYYTHPIDGTLMIDAKQLNYRYEIYDYEKAALRKYRLNPEERDLNTDHRVDPDEVVMISKDTAYIDDNGKIVRQTIERPAVGTVGLPEYVYRERLSRHHLLDKRLPQRSKRNVHATLLEFALLQRLPRGRRHLGASQRLLRMAYGIPHERPWQPSTLRAALPSAD